MKLLKTFQTAHRNWVYDAVTKCNFNRESHWTESIAIGNNDFVTKMHYQLGGQAKGRKIVEVGETFQICENIESYNAIFDTEKYGLWDVVDKLHKLHQKVEFV